MEKTKDYKERTTHSNLGTEPNIFYSKVNILTNTL